MDIITLLCLEHFMRTHESFIINKNHVLDYEKRGDGLAAKLINDVTALVSELYKTTFTTWFKEREN